MNTIVTGDNALTPVQLTVEGVEFDVSAASSLSAMLVSKTSREKYMAAAAAQSPLTPGADWTTGLIAVVFPGADTAAITFQGEACIEIQATLGTLQKTWFSPINIRKGHIS